MKASEFKTKTVEELVSLSETKRSELSKLKFRHSMGQLEKTANLKKLRKEIAVINTFISLGDISKSANLKTRNAGTAKKN